MLQRFWMNCALTNVLVESGQFICLSRTFNNRNRRKAASWKNNDFKHMKYVILNILLYF